METDKALISILMAVYEPHMDWLRIQLNSLNAQTYPNIRLYIRDDCSPAVSYEDIKALAAECITAFPFIIQRNEKNLGSNGTFERLTREATGDLFAYCDQDDIWLPEKLSKLQKLLEKQQAMLAYSDMSVMDGDGYDTAKSLRQVRPRLRYLQGKDLLSQYAFANCTAGCSLLMQTDIAKRAIPFPAKTVFDQWLCMIAAYTGCIAFENSPLVRYRIHGGNQTGILTGIKCKQDYMEKRILPMQERVVEFNRRFGAPPEVKAFANALAQQQIGKIWKYRRLCPKDAAFEIAMRILPNYIIEKILKKVSSNE